MGYTLAIGLSAAAALASTAQQADVARSAGNARKRQGQAQELAKSEAQSQRRKSDMAQSQANRKRPDIGQILAGAQGGGGGVDSTILTNPAGLGAVAGALRLG